MPASTPGSRTTRSDPDPACSAGCAEPLRSQYLMPLLTGEKRAGFAFTEPDDAAHFTRAVSTAEGLRVTGRKSYVTGGGSADFLNALVEIQGQGRAMLVIDTNAPGVVLERRFASLDGSHHAAFRFDDVLVPADRIIGRPGEGLPRAMRQIGDTRLLIAAEAVGLARWAIEFTTRASEGAAPLGRTARRPRRRAVALRRSADSHVCRAQHVVSHRSPRRSRREHRE